MNDPEPRSSSLNVFEMRCLGWRQSCWLLARLAFLQIFIGSVTSENLNKNETVALSVLPRVLLIQCYYRRKPKLTIFILDSSIISLESFSNSLAVTFWECLTRHVPWSWLPEKQISESRHLPILVCWPSLIKILLGQCLDDADKRPTADIVCRKLGEFMRLGIWLDRYQLDNMFNTWLADHAKAASRRSVASSRSNVVTIALGEKYSSLVESRTSFTREKLKGKNLSEDIRS